MTFERKILLLIGFLSCSLFVLAFFALRQPEVTTEMKDDIGATIQPAEKSELTGYEMTISHLLDKEDWVNSASVFLDYVDESREAISVTIIVDSAEVKDKKNDIMSIVINNITNLDVNELLILDMQGNKIS